MTKADKKAQQQEREAQLNGCADCEKGPGGRKSQIRVKPGTKEVEVCCRLVNRWVDPTTQIDPANCHRRVNVGSAIKKKLAALK